MNREIKARLVADLLKWAQAARDAGEPKTAYTKVLREAIHFIWERDAGKGKRAAAQYVSLALDGERYRYDHSVPITIVINKLMTLNPPTDERVTEVLSKSMVALITPDEDARLSALGLRSAMPVGWEWGDDPLARYNTAGIRLRPA